jgi:prepilin-type N-terminal cleavage/methylation domain-containing protein
MRNEKGFTLIELVVIMAIILALSLIAIPQYIKYKSKAYDATAVSALRNAATAQEAYFQDNQVYTDNIIDLIDKGLVITAENSVMFTLEVGDPPVSYKMTAWHESGSIVYVLEGPGGVIKESP